MKLHTLLLALIAAVGCSAGADEDGDGSGVGGWTATGAITGGGGYVSGTGGLLGSGGGFAGSGGGFVGTGAAFGSGGGFGTGGAFGSGGLATGGAGTGGIGVGTGGAATTGGSVGSGGSTASVPPSDLPAPSGSVAKPTGAVGGLSILDWAGFKGALSYTFDDSLSSQIQHYDELKATGVRMTFYVVSNNNASSQTWKTAVKDGHELANHTAHHCKDNGTQCAWGAYAGSLASEISQCSSYITGTLGAPGVWTMAAPYGDGGYSTAAQATLFLNRGVNGGQIGAGASDTTNPFSLPCQTAQPSQSAATFNAATNSARSGGKWQIFLIHSLGGDGGYNPISTSELLSSINYAKGLGDMWIDSVVNVGAYWRAQKVLASVTPQISGSSTTWSWTLPANFPPGKYLRVKFTGGSVTQNGKSVPWSSRGYYEIALDEGKMTLSP